jgi:electron transfer flavoprotein alpha subunit
MDILVVLEESKGTIHRMSIEAVVAAQTIGQGLNMSTGALALGPKASVMAEQASGYQLNEVFTLTHDQLATYSAEGYATAVARAITELKPTYVIFGHTYQVRDYVPKVSAKLKKPFLVDNIQFSTQGGKAFFTKLIMHSKLAGKIQPQGEPPYLVSFQSAAFQADHVRSGQAPVKPLQVEIEAGTVRSVSEEPFQADTGGVDLTSAEIIVSVGRGIGKEENLPMVFELAKAIGGEVGSSRPVVDIGWLPFSRQVGSSGQTVSPKLYLALGISGAIQHVVGMKGSKKVVAINKDPEAPIFELADYGVVGDILEIVPQLTAALQSQ